MSDLRTQLTGIYRKNGQLTPRIVVDEASQETSPLHSRFEWDDRIAGDKYRLTQAAQLIRVARIEYTAPGSEDRKFVRAFSSLHEIGDSERAGYAPTEELIENPVTRKILLRNMERDIADLKRKYGHLNEFISIMRSEFGGEEVA